MRVSVCVCVCVCVVKTYLMFTIDYSSFFPACIFTVTNEVADETDGAKNDGIEFCIGGAVRRTPLIPYCA